MLRLALINGCQKKASRYAQAVRRLRNVRFVGLVQPDQAVREAAAKELSTEVAVESSQMLLDFHRNEFDAVIIHGPIQTRAVLACQMAEAGKHVFVSSPLAVSISEIDEIAMACRVADASLAVGSHMRSSPSIVALRSALESGQLGLPGLLRTHCWEPKDPEAPDLAKNINDRRIDVFNARVIQQLDLALWVFSKNPTELFVACNEYQSNMNCWPNYLQIHLGFPHGGMALITISRGLPPGDGYHSVSLIGSRGAAYADEQAQKHLLFRGQSPQALQGDEVIPSLVNQLRDFVAAIDNRRDPHAATHDIKAATTLTDAAWTSLTEKRVVSLGDGQ